MAGRLPFPIRVPAKDPLLPIRSTWAETTIIRRKPANIFPTWVPMIPGPESLFYFFPPFIMTYLDDKDDTSDAPSEDTGTPKPPPTDEFGLSKPGGSDSM